MNPNANLPPTRPHFPMSHATQSLPTSVSTSPIFVEYQLMKEFVLFQKQEIPHVYITPSHRSAFEWFGVMFIHNGLYQEKIFRFKLCISSSYPNCDLPKVIFEPIPVHPLVDATTGQLDMSRKFVKWNSTNNFIFEVIGFVRGVFEIDRAECLKPLVESGKPLDSKFLAAAIKRRMGGFNDAVITHKCDDKHYIDFTDPENEALLEKLRHKLLHEKIPIGGTESSSGPQVNPNNFNTHASLNAINNKNYCSTSITGLSWTKKIIYK